MVDVLCLFFKKKKILFWGFPGFPLDFPWVSDGNKQV